MFLHLGRHFVSCSKKTGKQVDGGFGGHYNRGDCG